MEKNRLHVTLVETITKRDASSLYTEIRFCVADLKPGFDVITDLTRCRIAHISGLPSFVKVREFLLAKEVGTIVRIVGKGKLIFKQFQRITGNKSGYNIVYVSTLQEAEEALRQH